jgi:protein regulator of cytokinesis 1
VRIVAAEKNEMTEEGHRIITTIKQMEASLDDTKTHHQYEAEDEDLKISYPLLQCLKGLKEKHLQISKLHKERFEQVKSKPS